jgi:dihydropyrimidinase
MYDLIIKNGMVVISNITIKTDIAVKDGKIISVGKVEQGESAERIIDAAGKYILPGVIDAHMHVEAPFQGCIGANDFYTQSVSAAFGGVTTFFDFTNTFKGRSILEAIDERKKEMSKSAIDYSVHAKIVESPDNILNEIKELNNYGCPSFKIFMTYRKEGVMADDETILKVFKAAREYNLLAMVHAECNAIAESNIEIFRNRGDLGWSRFPEAKPVLCEAEAVSRAVLFSRYAGNALLLVHTTNGEALDIARQSQKKDYPVYVETCPQYLTMNSDFYNREDGYLAICSPPLRSLNEAERLWKGIGESTISVTGSDDCTYSQQEKTMFLEKNQDGTFVQDFTKVVNGVSGIETRLPILLSEGVSKGRISINKLADITSTNIAKLFGIYPQKGIIAPGSDADLVIIDMNREVTLCPQILHNNIDYCLYEGMKIKGYPVMTISKGDVIVENGKFYGERGRGSFIKRKNSNILKKFSF